MNSQIKTLWVALIAVAIIAVVGLFVPRGVQNAFGGVGGTRFPHGVSVGTNILTTAGGFKIGDSGSEFAMLLGVKGTGAIIGNRPVAATTTAAFDIAVTGIVSGDACVAQGASTTQTSLGFSIVGCSASTTAGFATVLVANGSGASNVIPYPVASATSVWIFR